MNYFNILVCIGGVTLIAYLLANKMRHMMSQVRLFKTVTKGGDPEDLPDKEELQNLIMTVAKQLHKKKEEEKKDGNRGMYG